MKFTAFSGSLAEAIAHNSDITGISRGTSSAGSLYMGLHYADPGRAGNQSTNEMTYTGYGRVGIPRTTGGLTVTGPSWSPATDVTFGQRTDGGSASIGLYMSIGTASTGAGVSLYSGPISGGQAMQPFTAVAATDAVVIPGNILAVNDTVAFFSPLPVSTLPGGVNEGQVYYTLSSSGNTITLSTSQGGSLLNISADGGGLAQKVSPITVSQNSIPIVKATSTIKED